MSEYFLHLLMFFSCSVENPEKLDKENNEDNEIGDREHDPRYCVNCFRSLEWILKHSLLQNLNINVQDIR